MSVATFSQRAIKVYHKCGFKDVGIKRQETNGKAMNFYN